MEYLNQYINENVLCHGINLNPETWSRICPVPVSSLEHAVRTAHCVCWGIRGVIDSQLYLEFQAAKYYYFIHFNTSEKFTTIIQSGCPRT